MLVRKICMIGDFAVGKTSLVARFVHSTFSERYLSTVGVKIDTRSIDLASGTQVKFVIWDVAGTDVLTTVERNYLQGATGLILVADGTRKQTLQSALDLGQQAHSVVGQKPTVLLLNKYDLDDLWELSSDPQVEGYPVSRCSALSGQGVEQAFHDLASMLAA